MRTGARHHCCSAYLTFVSVLARPGADGRPARRMKRVAPTLPNHHVIFESAERCASFPCFAMTAACQVPVGLVIRPANLQFVLLRRKHSCGV